MNANPLTRLLAAVGFLVLLFLSFLLGAVALVVILGLAMILGTITMIRFWWITRQIRRTAGGVNPGNAPSSTQSARRREVYIIEGEFRRDDQSDGQSDEREP